MGKFRKLFVVLLLAFVLLCCCAVNAFAEPYTVTVNSYDSDRTTLSPFDGDTSKLYVFLEIKDKNNPDNVVGWDAIPFTPTSTEPTTVMTCEKFRNTSINLYTPGSIDFNSEIHKVSSVHLVSGEMWNISYNNVIANTNVTIDTIDGYTVEPPANPGETGSVINLYQKSKYTVNVNFYDTDGTTPSAFNTPNINNLWVYLEIKEKDHAGDDDPIVGWSVQNFNPQGIPTKPLQFLEFTNTGNVDNLPDNIPFNPAEYTVTRVRLYSTAPTYHLVRDEELNEGESRPDDTISGYKFMLNSGPIDYNKYNVNVQRWDHSDFLININFDPEVLSITESDGYWVWAELTHNSGQPTYFVQKLSTSGATLTGNTLQINANSWIYQNGSSADPFTGNEPNVTVHILKALTDQQNLPATEVAKLNANLVEVIQDEDDVKGYMVNYVDGNPLVIKDRKTDDYTNAVTTCIYNIYLTKPTLEPALTPEDILGEAVEYGIVADTYYQTGHTETNFAVNTLNDNAELDIDGSGGAPIPFYVGVIEDVFKFGEHTNVDVDIFAPQGVLDAVERHPRTTHLVNKYPTDINTVNNYVNGLIQAGRDTSAALASKTTIKPVSDSEHYTLDTTGFADGTTIYVDADGILNAIANNGLTINKLPNQSIVFNINAASSDPNAPEGQRKIKIGKFFVDPNDGNGIVDPSTVPYGGTSDEDKAKNKRVDDVILSHITFNVTEATNVELADAAGLFLLPNAEYVTQTNGAGWILAAGEIESHTEWHFYRHTRSYKAKGDFTLQTKKNFTDDNGNTIPFGGTKFRFDLYETNADGQILTTCEHTNDNNQTVQGECLIETVWADASTGLIDFHSIKYTDADFTGNETGITRYYLLKEVIPDETDDIHYDTSEIPVKITAVKTAIPGSDPIQYNITFTAAIKNQNATDAANQWINVAGTTDQHPVFSLRTVSDNEVNKDFTNTKSGKISAKKAWRNLDNTPLVPQSGTTVTYVLYQKIGDGAPAKTEYTVELDGIGPFNAPAETSPIQIQGYESAAWTATFIHLPGIDTATGQPITYFIGEEVPAGYSASPKDPVADDGTITNTLGTEIQLTGTKSVSPSTAQTSLSGFTFTLTERITQGSEIVDGETYSAVTDANGGFTIPAISYTADDIDTTHTYILDETIPNGSSYTKPDTLPAEIQVKIERSADGKSLEITSAVIKGQGAAASTALSPASPTDPHLYVIPSDYTTNTYDQTGAAGQVKFEVGKSINKWPNAIESFSFTIAAAAGDYFDVSNEKLTGVTLTESINRSDYSTDPNTTAEFGPIQFNQDDDGKTYQFTISENGPSDPGNTNGVTYDTKTFNITLTVAQSGSIMVPTITAVTYGTGSDTQTVEAARSDPDNNLYIFTFNKTFTNTYAAVGNAQLEVTKALSGALWPSGKTATFTLAPVDRKSVV